VEEVLELGSATIRLLLLLVSQPMAEVVEKAKVPPILIKTVVQEVEPRAEVVLDR
jgi:hypothetical protein